MCWLYVCVWYLTDGKVNCTEELAFPRSPLVFLTQCMEVAKASTFLPVGPFICKDGKVKTKMEFKNISISC